MGASKRFNCSLCSFSSISLDVMEEHQLLHPEGVAFIRVSSGASVAVHGGHVSAGLRIKGSFALIVCCSVFFLNSNFELKPYVISE